MRLDENFQFQQTTAKQNITLREMELSPDGVLYVVNPPLVWRYYPTVGRFTTLGDGAGMAAP